MADNSVSRNPGVMERQQLTGGRHDRFSNQRQRESGSSRGESDLTLIRRAGEPSAIQGTSIEGGDPGILKSPDSSAGLAAVPATPPAAAYDPRTGGAGPSPTADAKDAKNPHGPAGAPSSSKTSSGGLEF